MLTEEEAEKLRKALISQLDAMSLPPEEMRTAKLQIESTPAEKLEEFAKSSCIFCRIVKNQVESFKVAESKNAVVVLEINPMSKGHSILIPKSHTSSLADFAKDSFMLLLAAIKRISQELKPKTINITSSEISGHAMINILPLYGTETGKREKAEQEELENLAKILHFEADIEEKEETEKEKPKKQAKPKKQEQKEEFSEPEIIIEQVPERIP